MDMDSIPCILIYWDWNGHGFDPVHPQLLPQVRASMLEIIVSPHTHIVSFLNIMLYIFPLQVRNIPHEGAKNVFILRTVSMAPNTNAMSLSL
jgi:hypothetical protein